MLPGRPAPRGRPGVRLPDTTRCTHPRVRLPATRGRAARPGSPIRAHSRGELPRGACTFRGTPLDAGEAPEHIGVTVRALSQAVRGARSTDPTALRTERFPHDRHLRHRPDPHKRRRLRRTLVAGAGALALGAGAVTLTGPSAGASVPPPPSGWTQVFADDFEGPEGSGVDPGNWRYATGTGYPGGPANWGTGEIETMTSSPDNVSLDGSGNLRITPRRDGAGTWTSGRVETNRDDFRPRPAARCGSRPASRCRTSPVTPPRATGPRSGCSAPPTGATTGTGPPSESWTSWRTPRA